MEDAFESGDVAAFTSADERFHEALRTASKNEKLVRSLTNLREQVQRLHTITSRINKVMSVSDHRETFEAVLAGDGDRARQITQAHWARVREDTLAVVP